MQIVTQEIQLLRDLHMYRLQAQDAKMALQEAKAKWERDNRFLFDELERAQGNLARVEAIVRNMTVARYRDTGSKEPLPGCRVRIMTKLHYDPAEALDWAYEHNMALSLDVRAFEKVARATPDTVNGLVTFEEVPQAAIAADLSGHVK